MSSSLTLFAGSSAITPFAVSQRPWISRASIDFASENTRRADSPTISSFRIAGYGPARSQVWKNGPQSMKFASSFRS